MRIYHMVLANLLCVHVSASAQKVVLPVYVFSEEDTSTIKSCGLSNQSAVAAVQATLRANGLQVIYKQQFASIKAYININALMLLNSCAANVDIKLWVGGTADYPTLRTISGELELCTNGGILSGPVYDLQERLNSILIDLTRRCVSEADATLNP